MKTFTIGNKTTVIIGHGERVDFDQLVHFKDGDDDFTPNFQEMRGNGLECDPYTLREWLMPDMSVNYAENPGSPLWCHTVGVITLVYHK